MARSFRWKDKSGPYGDLAIYANEDGDICLRQWNPPSEEDDDIIVIPRDHALQIIAAIETELKRATPLRRQNRVKKRK